MEEIYDLQKPLEGYDTNKIVTRENNFLLFLHNKHEKCDPEEC